MAARAVQSATAMLGHGIEKIQYTADAGQQNALTSARLFVRYKKTGHYTEPHLEV